MEALDPEMILLVEHDADQLLNQERGARPDPALGIETRQFLADQMPLVQQLAVDPVQPVEPEPGGPPEQAGLPGDRLYGGQNLLTLGFGVPPLEDMAGQVPGQPDPGRKHEMTG